MQKSEVDPKILDQIKKLEEKYEAMGQNLSAYLDGLLYSDYLTYWDYIHLDTLLSLQNPKTGIEDEMTFIIYHQHTELFFKLILWEIEQLANHPEPDEAFFITKLSRMVRQFEVLENSFMVMMDGMDKEQFLKFRMSLLPASGFQSAQYRLIELSSTDIHNLVSYEKRDMVLPDDIIETLLDKIYWRAGATELASGKKTLTLKQFEQKYMDTFINRAREYGGKNLLRIYQRYFSQSENPEIIKLLRDYDYAVNVAWRLAHYKSAANYLHKDAQDIAATGGTNWQKYLPPRFQKIVFFPELWSEQELKEWGKPWVMKEIFKS